MKQQSLTLDPQLARPLTGEEALHRLVKSSGVVVAGMKQRVADLRAGVHSGLADLKALAAEGGNPDVWEALKHERIAVVSILVEDAWAQILDQSKESESGLFDHFGRPVSVEKLKQSPYPLRDITDGVHATYTRGLSDWEQRMEESRAEDTPAHFCYRRYFEMAEATDSFRTPRSAMESGFSAALGIEHAMHDVIPKVFERQYGRAPNAVELAQILDASYQNFLAVPSLLHREARIDRIQENYIAIMPHEARPRPFHGTMDPQHHAIEGSRLIDIRLKKPVALPMKLADLREGQAGCPAHYAEATQGKGNIVREFDSYYRSFTNRFYLSRFNTQELA